jgi:hypothetical protein
MNYLFLLIQLAFSSPYGANRPPVGKGLRPQVGASLPTSPYGANRPPVGKGLRPQVGTRSD